MDDYFGVLFSILILAGVGSLGAYAAWAAMKKGRRETRNGLAVGFLGAVLAALGLVGGFIIGIKLGEKLGGDTLEGLIYFIFGITIGPVVGTAVGVYLAAILGRWWGSDGNRK